MAPFVSKNSTQDKSKRPQKKALLYLMTTLLLAGDIHLNPGPGDIGVAQCLALSPGAAPGDVLQSPLVDIVGGVELNSGASPGGVFQLPPVDICGRIGIGRGLTVGPNSAGDSPAFLAVAAGGQARAGCNLDVLSGCVEGGGWLDLSPCVGRRETQWTVGCREAS